MKRLIVIGLTVLLVVSCACGCAATSSSEPTELANSSTPSQEIMETIVLTEATEATEPIVVETEPIETEPPYKDYEYFIPDFFYEIEYIANGEVMPHIFFEPECAADYEKLPLVIWLHGSGEKNSSVDEFQINSLRVGLAAAAFYGYETLNAYFVAPHLVNGPFWTSVWCEQRAADNVQALIDYYVEHYNVDPNQVVITGHSLGGQGAVYLPQVLPDTFCAMAPLSVYNPCIPLTNKDIPAWCFQGEQKYGEASVSIEYAYSTFKNFYGEDSVTSLPVGHGDLPLAVFSMDNDANMRLDIMEWMAEHMANSATQHSTNNLAAE